MLLKQAGAIKEMLLPPDFAEGEKQFGGTGLNWSLTYQPKQFSNDTKFARIISYYRGLPVSQRETTAFRTTLLTAPKVIWQEPSDTGAVRMTLQELGDALGPAADNQLTNTLDGLQAPRFLIQSIETKLLVRKPVIAIKGLFHFHELKKLDEILGHPQTSHYYGLLYDATPDQEQAQIQELMLSTSTKDLYDRYFPAFERSLLTIRWQA